jgi:hypothetical protein
VSTDTSSQIQNKWSYLLPVCRVVTLGGLLALAGSGSQSVFAAGMPIAAKSSPQDIHLFGQCSCSPAERGLPHDLNKIELVMPIEANLGGARRC